MLTIEQRRNTDGKRRERCQPYLSTIQEAQRQK